MISSTIDDIKSRRTKGGVDDAGYSDDKPKTAKDGKGENPAKLLSKIEMLEERNAKHEIDKEKLVKKIEALKRNYEGLSNSTKSEKSEFLTLK